MLGHFCLLIGFLLFVTGVFLWSVPAGCVVAGLLLFLAGGLDVRRRDGERT